MDYELNIREVIYALTEALDLVGIDDTRHGKRVAFMAAECARAAGFDEAFIDDIIGIGMLHDCGVSTTDVHRSLVTQLEWKDEQIHCERGAILLGKVALFQRFALPVYYHHTHWELLEHLPVDRRVKQLANLIYLADRVDALRSQMGGSGLEQSAEIERVIVEHSGTFFAPDFVEAFQKASGRNSFWFSLEDEPLEEQLMEWVGRGENRPFSFSAVREMAQMFADVVDAKSPFTFEHSFGVAALANFLARGFGLDEQRRETVEIAALLHDLGKLRVEDAILNKNGRLDAGEKILMNRHGFDSNMILRRIHGFRGIARIASLHHEMLDGKGYPYSLGEEEIPLEARIVTVADIFQALVQTRPYRAAMEPDAAFAILQEMADNGKIDTAVVAMIGTNLQQAYRLAKYKERVKAA
ncbi:HD domain-containing protein [Sulfurimonas sp. HSL-3221]|uniref:HD domain-containing phosphohydrolase n=1 Tax=Sulfurimonadaceae TaxID=2771471 RepID=UPI001E5977F3|nr:HD domain-containing phosphohydrolase [Sulfurimonas sp. HSL-3221]UFS63656.1 HD domain-containing protein [Sulfurimonas sp. HSL-3221]